jgi:hypothetical protein
VIPSHKSVFQDAQELRTEGVFNGKLDRRRIGGVILNSVFADQGPFQCDRELSYHSTELHVYGVDLG